MKKTGGKGGRKLRVGVVGLGIGRHHAKGYQADGRVELAALCDTNAERLKAAATEFNVPQTFSDAEEMFKKADLDAVSIATPNKFHAPLTMAALSRGLHVLCEKPMAMSAREAERMNAAAAKARRNLMINFSFRFNNMSHALKQQVDSGAIGRIYFGRTVWHRRRGVPGMGGWFTDKALAGGGPLIDLGVHRLDLALWLMGYPEPERVSGSVHSELAPRLAREQKKSFTVEDAACGLVHFAGGSVLVVEASWALNIGQPEEMVTTLYGTKGGLVQKNIYGGYDFEATIYSEEGGNLFTKKLDAAVRPAPSAFNEFISSIEEKRKPIASGDDGLKVMKILDGIYKSAETGREIRYK